MRTIHFVLLLLLPIASGAGPFEYVCTIKQELSVASDGSLKPYKNPIEVGNTFAIDRKTGKIIGKPFNNSTAGEVKVLNGGSTKHSFEVLSVSSPTGKVTTDLIAVHEYMKGQEKTFIGVESGTGTVYSGTCK